MTTEQWRELVDALEPMLIGKPLSRQAIDALAKAVAPLTFSSPDAAKVRPGSVSA